MAELSLVEALTLADTEFESAARKCGAVVVKHTWGIAPYAGRNRPPSSFNIDGYQLVAEVEAVSPVEPPVEVIETRKRGIDQLWDELLDDERPYDGLRWTDVMPDAYMYGTTQSQPVPHDQIIDIDMVLYPSA